MAPPRLSTARTVAGCQGKERFVEKSRADKAAARISGRTVYFCKDCKGWHVGSNEQRRRNK